MQTVKTHTTKTYRRRKDGQTEQKVLRAKKTWQRIKK